MSTPINRRPGRLWSFLQFPVTRILILCVLLVSVAVLVQVAARALGIKPASMAGLAPAALSIVAVLAVYCAGVRVLEQRRVMELGARRAGAGLLIGLVTGMLLFAAVMLILVWLGVGAVTAAQGWRALPVALATALAAAVLEETLIRGVLFRIVEESLGSWITLALTAALFGALHGFNPGASLQSTTAIALEAGVLLAAVYMYSRTLWMPIGLHAGWNFTEGGLFGASVSGGSAHGMFASHFHGSDLLTGGAFGPEASVVAVLVCLTLGVTFMYLSKRRGNVVPPRWRRGPPQARAAI